MGQHKKPLADIITDPDVFTSWKDEENFYMVHLLTFCRVLHLIFQNQILIHLLKMTKLIRILNIPNHKANMH